MTQDELNAAAQDEVKLISGIADKLYQFLIAKVFNAMTDALFAIRSGPALRPGLKGLSASAAAPSSIIPPGQGGGAHRLGAPGTGLAAQLGHQQTETRGRPSSHCGGLATRAPKGIAPPGRVTAHLRALPNPDLSRSR